MRAEDLDVLDDAFVITAVITRRSRQARSWEGGPLVRLALCEKELEPSSSGCLPERRALGQAGFAVRLPARAARVCAECAVDTRLGFCPL